jgi:hypothetical protein
VSDVTRPPGRVSSGSVEPRPCNDAPRAGAAPTGDIARVDLSCAPIVLAPDRGASLKGGLAAAVLQGQTRGRLASCADATIRAPLRTAPTCVSAGASAGSSRMALARARL